MSRSHWANRCAMDENVKFCLQFPYVPVLVNQNAKSVLSVSAFKFQSVFFSTICYIKENSKNYKKYLTLYAPITTAADDIFCASFLMFGKNKG